MSSINPEMLKQLLSEFEEKEAVCQEEIIAITDQIAELEKRIESSKERLGSVARDREKIGQMKQRYAEGDWSAVLAQVKYNNGGGTAVASAPALAVEPAVAASAPAPGSAPASAPAPAPAPAPAVQVQAPPAAPPPPVLDVPSAARTGDYPPVLAPQQQLVEPPIPAPSPTVADMPMIPQPPVPNPFEQPPVSPSQPAFQMDAPSWDPPQPFQDPAAQQPMPAPMVAPEPVPQLAPPAPPAPASEGLFPFSAQQQQGDDIPWAPPPSMSWESVGSHTFPGQGGQPEAAPPQQAPQAVPPPFGDPSQMAQQPFQPAPAPMGFGDMPQGMPAPPPAGFMTPPPGPPPQNSQAVLTTAFDDEFDISDALRGEDENSGQDSRDNDKKIKDALRGLFS